MPGLEYFLRGPKMLTNKYLRNLTTSIPKKIRPGNAASHVVLLLAFFLPLSTSALSVFGLLLILLWAAEGNFSGKYREIITNPVALAIIIYLMLYPLSLLWTDNLGNGLEILRAQWKYLLLPVLLTTVRREQAHHYLTAFLSAMSISALASFLLWFGLFHASHGSPADPTPFLDRIDFTPFLAFSAYLLAEAATHHLRGRARLAATLLAIVLSFDVFITQGRTGQVAFLVMLSVWLFQLFPGRALRAGIISGLCLLLITVGAYSFSANFKTRVNQTIANVHEFDRKPDTSLGQRLIFLRNSWELAMTHPWLGTSPGDFAAEYRQINQRESPAFPDTDNPHNQYLLALTNFGLLGLLLFAGIFWRMVRFRPAEPDGLTRLRIGFAIFYLTIMAGGSYLSHFHAGFLFILGTALLFNNYPAQLSGIPSPEPDASGALPA